MSKPWVHLEARRGLPKLHLRDLWQFRELLLLMACRDFQLRYRQTMLGVLWAVMPTLFSGLVFIFFFGQVARFRSDGVPYSAFYFAAIVPWNFFNYILMQSAGSLTTHFHLLNKVYFPRLILPLKSVLVASVDFVLASSLIALVMAYHTMAPTANIVWLPAFVLLAAMTGLGVGIWFAALSAYLRDLYLLLPYLSQIWFFMTAIFYSTTMLEDHKPWDRLALLNPMTSVAMGFRWSLFGSGPPPDYMLVVVFLLTGMVLLSGLYFFRKAERTIADVL